MHIFKHNSTLFLLSLGFIGSAALHAAAMFTPMPMLWRQAEKESENTIEVVVESAEKPIIAEKIETPPEIIKEPQLIPQASKVEAAPAIIALAPEMPQNNIGRDAPASDRLNPMTSTTGDMAIPTNAIGKIIKENARGWGFGIDKEPTGFLRGGNPEGDVNGVEGGKKDGVVNGNPNGKGAEPIGTLNTTPGLDIPRPPTVPSSTPLKLECTSCPKPRFRGKEGTPRVTYDITADGKVTNIRLRQSSGDPETDRETLEAMNKWQFNPKTIPEGGRANVKVRVTFEESGSQFQRQNEDARRRQEAEQQRIVEKERKREAEPIVTKEPVTKETVTKEIVIREPVKLPNPAKPEPIYAEPPSPAYVPPAYVPPPEPAYVAPPEAVPAPPAELPPPPTENPQ